MTNLTTNYYVQQAISFTDADLEANRAGYTTDEQIHYLRTLGTQNAQLYKGKILRYSIIVIVLLAIIPFYEVTSNYENFSLKISILLIIIFPLLRIVALIQSLKWAITMKNTINGVVVSQTATVRSYLMDLNIAFGSVIEANVTGDKFRVPFELIKCLEDGQVYTIYYLLNNRVIVSLEKENKAILVRVIKDELKYLDSVRADLKAKNKSKNT